jgi:sugar lactone lactonase YvrE
LSVRRIDPAALGRVGVDLQRPEGIMCARDGTVWAADGRGACTRIAAGGAREERVGALGGEPNGICLDRDGHVIVANLHGEVQRLDPVTGKQESLATHASGRKLMAPNFPFVDRQDRLWVSNSTERAALMDAVQKPDADGTLVRVFPDRAEIVADGLWFANGVAVDAADAFVYVAETTANRVSRFAIRSDGSLGSRETYGSDLGTAPDGIAFDEAGNLWVALPMVHGIGVLRPDGSFEVVLEDPTGAWLRLPTNVCFGGPDRRTAYVGNLVGPSVLTFPIEVPGMALVHQGQG